MNLPKNLHSLPLSENEVWEGGRIKMPFWVKDREGDPFRPIMEIWVEQQSGVVISYNLVMQLPTLQSSVGFLVQSMTAPLVGPPRRPGRLRVAEKPLASLLHKKLANAGISVEQIGQCALAHNVVAEMSKNMEGRGRHKSMPALMSLKGVTPERAGSFFQAAAFFYGKAPWRFLSDENPLEISCLEFSRNPVYLVVMGNAGMEFGLMLFFDIKDLQRLYDSDGEYDIVGKPFRAASMSFSDPTYLDMADLDAIEHHGWPVAGPNAYPHLFQILPDRKPRIQAPSLDQVDIFEACLRAVPQVTAKHKADYRAGNSFTETVPVETFHGKWQLRMTWPPQAWRKT